MGLDAVDWMSDREGQGRVRGAVASLALALLACASSPAPVRGQGAEQRSAGLEGEEPASSDRGEVEVWIERADELLAQGARRAAVEMLVERGRGWLQAERTADAVAVLEAATERQPDAAAGWTWLGRAYTRDRDFEAARRALERAVELGDTTAATRVFLGAVQWEGGDLAAAEETYRRAIAGGDGGVASAQLGRLLVWQGRYAEAVEVLDSTVGPGTPADVLFDRAEALRGAGETEAAIAAYRHLCQLAPTLFKARYGLAVVLGQAGQEEASADELARYAELYRQDQEWTRIHERNQGEMERARSMVREGRFEEALEHLAGLAQSAEVLALTARAYSLAGRPDEALAALERAVSLDPSRLDLRRQLGEMRMRPPGNGP
jgi:tetratricopeptide (TPR) repeat protein